MSMTCGLPRASPCSPNIVVCTDGDDELAKCSFREWSLNNSSVKIDTRTITHTLMYVTSSLLYSTRALVACPVRMTCDH